MAVEVILMCRKAHSTEYVIIAHFEHAWSEECDAWSLTGLRISSCFTVDDLRWNTLHFNLIPVLRPWVEVDDLRVTSKKMGQQYPEAL